MSVAPRDDVVLVSGCYDLLHSGHVAFFRAASALGRLVVSIGSDENIKRLKKHQAMFPQQERLYMVQSIRAVADAFVSTGKGYLDFEDALEQLQPDTFFVNADGDREEKRVACERRGVAYVVGERLPECGLAARSSTQLKAGAARTDASDASGHNAAADRTSFGPVPPKAARSRPVVLVCGSFDFLHSGHVSFLEEASRRGDVYVSVWDDASAERQMGRRPKFPANERAFMLDNIRFVKATRICGGHFIDELNSLNPDIVFLNGADADEPIVELADIRRQCEAKGIPLEIGRDFHDKHDFPLRTATSIQSMLDAEAELYSFPWRICLAGGWLDQPWVSSLAPGSVIVVNIHADDQFKRRCGLATSTRTVGSRLWGTREGGRPPSTVPPEELARMLFGAENPPGCEFVSGAQDALGLMLPGVSRLSFDGSYWPTAIERCEDAESLQWLERILWLIPLQPRPPGYNPLKTKNLSRETVEAIAHASDQAWDAIKQRNAERLGHALSQTMVAWRQLLPETVPQPQSDEWMAPYKQLGHGCLFSGAGGGFLMLVSERDHIPNGFRIRINTGSFWD